MGLVASDLFVRKYLIVGGVFCAGADDGLLALV